MAAGLVAVLSGVLAGVLVLVLAGCSTGSTGDRSAADRSPGGDATAAAESGGTAAQAEAVRHVFIVNLENKGYAETFGPDSPAPYLSRTLTKRGQLLENYYGIAHHSLPNYLAQISGQGPNPKTQADCPVFSRFRQTGVADPGQAVGDGCVYPAHVETVAGQLTAAGLSWRGYLEDMGTPCRHPVVGATDETQRADEGDQYAVKHNPFVYFKAVTTSPSCDRQDVDLEQLPEDLRRVATTANLSYIVPSLCNDGHDSPCVDGRPGGLVSADAWLRSWVPKILASPAYRKDGLLVVTFDEAATGHEDSARACCVGTLAPNAESPGITGPGGGRTGTVLLSPFINAGTTNPTAYNHYSLLRTVEDAFDLAPLGYAQRAEGFGADVFGAGG